MIRTSRQLLIVVIIWVISFQSTVTEDIKSVTISTGEWVPLHAEKCDNQGIATEIIFEAFRAEGVHAKFEFFPWERSFQVAKEGKAFQTTAIWEKELKG